MKLYFKPGACSLAARIALTELGIAFEATKVDTAAGKTDGGADYLAVNPKGYVPALEIEDGAILTENPAILQFIADRKPGAGLAPVAGSLARVRLQEWLNFVSSELHKAFAPFFGAVSLGAGERHLAENHLRRRIDDVERALADGRTHLLGETFTVADAYLFVVLNWAGFIAFDLAKYPHTKAYVARVAARPAVRQAMIAEGLVAQAAQ